MTDANDLSAKELWALYANVVKRLKEIGEIRTKNITGERGENLAINFYNETPGLPKLQAAPKGTQNVDAISRKGDRYTIKTIMSPNKTTGVFYGLGTLSEQINDKKFEFLIIVVINEYYELEKIIELTWENFYKHKKWHSRMNAFNMSVTLNLYKSSKLIYEKIS